MRKIDNIEEFKAPSQELKYVKLEAKNGKQFELAFDLYTTNPFRIYSETFSQYEYIEFTEIPKGFMEIFDTADGKNFARFCGYLEKYLPIIDTEDIGEYHEYIENIIIECLRYLYEQKSQELINDIRQTAIDK